MAIAPGSQGLQELTFEMIKAGVNLSDDTAVRNYMKKNKYTDEDYDALQQGIDDIADGKRDGDFRPISATNRQLAESLEETPFEEQSFFERFLTGRLAENLMMEQGARLGIAAGAKGVKDVASIPVRPISAIGEAVAPETTQKVKGALKEATDYVDSKIQSTSTGRKISYTVKELVDPALTEEEETAVEIASTLVPLGIVNKMTKSLGVAEGKGKRLLDFVLFDYAIKNESDHQFSEVITAVIPATEPLLERLVIDENDTEAERELKKIIDSGLTAGLFETVFSLIGLTAKGIGEVVDRRQRKKIIDEILDTAREGSKERVRRAEAVAIDRVDEPIVTGATAKEVAEGAPVPIKTEVTELGDQYVQKGVIGRVLEPALSKMNTGLARILKSTGQLPEKLVPAFRERQGAYQSDLLEIKNINKILEKDLKRARREAKAAGKNPDEIDETARLALSGGLDDMQKLQFKINSLAETVNAQQTKKIISAGTRAKNKGATTKAQRSEIDKQTAKRVEESTAALKNDVRAAMQGDTKALLRLPKDIQKAITEATEVVGVGQRALNTLPKYLQESIRATKRTINKKSATVSELYGAKQADDFVIGLADDGTTYLTRAYEIFSNPKWAEALRAGIAARSAKAAGIKPTRKQQKISDKNTPEINEIIDNAFKNLRNKNPDVDEQIIWKTLDDYANVGGKDIDKGLIFEGLSGRRYASGDTSVKVLSKRNIGMNEPVLAFLGEIKDPLRMVDITLRNQSKAIALGKYGREIESFILSNAGKEVALGGFFNSLPKTSARFLAPSEQIAARAEQTPVGQFLGGATSSIGVGVPRIMPRVADYTTSKKMAEVLERGTELFAYDRPLGGALQQLVGGSQRIAAFGQSTQTTLDIQQHMNNVYGMFQALASGGFLTNPKQFVKFAQQARAETISASKTERRLRAAAAKSKVNQDVLDEALLGNKEAYAALPKNIQKIVDDAENLRFDMKLRKAGLLDSNVVSAPVKNATLDRWGDLKTMDSWIGRMLMFDNKLGNIIKKPLRGMQNLYGFFDDFGKKIAVKIEMEDLRKIYPNASEEFIFNKAVDNVMQVIPSYTYAAPIVRELGKYPIGAYPVYTAERLRNNFNIIRIAMEELREAVKTGNTALRTKAGKRIAALGGVYAAKEAYRISQELEYGWDEESKRGLKVLLPDWQRGSIQIPTEPFYMDEDGHIKTKFVDGSTFDADSYLRSPTARAYALIMDYNENELTDLELEQLQKGIFTDFVAQYYALKGFYGGVKTAISGYDEYGRPIYTGLNDFENFLNGMAALGEPLDPGSNINVANYIKSIQAEEVMGYGKGKTKSGFPNRSNEIKNFLMYGIRNNTFDIDMATSQVIKESLREQAEVANNFYQTIKDIDVRRRSQTEREELYKNIAERYYKVQDKGVEINKRLNDLGKAISGIKYDATTYMKENLERKVKKGTATKEDKKRLKELKEGDPVIKNLNLGNVIGILRADDTLSESAAGYAFDTMLGGVNTPITFDENQAIREFVKFDEGTVDKNILRMLYAIDAQYQGRRLNADK